MVVKNKVLIQLFVPMLNERYDIFIPTNERIGAVIKLFAKNLADLTGENIEKFSNCHILNQDNATFYEKNQIVRDTDIKNATRLMII